MIMTTKEHSILYTSLLQIYVQVSAEWIDNCFNFAGIEFLLRISF